MRQRLTDIDLVKGLAMLAVLYNHSFILMPINIHDEAWALWMQDINASFFLVSFFLVSGYLFNSPTLSKPSWQLLFKKLKRLLIPFLSFSALNYLVKLIAPSLVNKQVGSLSDYLYKVVVGGGELWFLYVLFLIFLVWMVVLPYMPKRKVIWVALAVFIADVIINGGKEPEGGVFLWSRVLHYSVYFLAGFVLRDMSSFRGYITSNKSLIISSALFILLCVVFTKQIQKLILGWPILCFIGCWFIWSFAAWLSKYEKVVSVLSYVGINSLGYYWLNGYVLVLVRVFVVSVLGMTFGPVVVLAIFMLCTTVETFLIIIIKKIPKLGILIGV